MHQQLTYYKLSGKFSPVSLLGAIAFCGIGSLILGFIYAYLMQWIPFIYLRVVLIFGYAACLMGVTGLATLIFKIRNKQVAFIYALLTGLFGIYIAWVVWLKLLVEADNYVFNIQMVWKAITYISQFGVWEIRGFEPKGIWLQLLWGCEAIALLVGAVIGPFTIAFSNPFCEVTGQWLSDPVKIEPLEVVEMGDAIKQEVERGRIEMLLNLEPLPGESLNFTRITLHGPAPDAEMTAVQTPLHALTISQVGKVINKDGNEEEKTQDIMTHFIVSPEIYSQLLELRGKVDEYAAAHSVSSEEAAAMPPESEEDGGATDENGVS